MTLLGWEDLDRAMKAPPEQRLWVTPMLDREEQVRSASIDMRLDTSFMLFRRSMHGGIDPLAAQESAIEATRERVTVPFGEGMWIHPQEMVLGATLEFVRMPDSMGAYVQGRSTWARLGLIVATAVMVHPGFAGSLTLELVNTSNTPLKLYPGFRIAQLAVHSLERETDRGYDLTPDPQYLASTGVQEAKQAWTSDEIQRVRGMGVRLLGGRIGDSV